MDNGLPKGPTKSGGRSPAEEAQRPTNTKEKILALRTTFIEGIPNLGALDLKFITLHPYKKDRNFKKNLILSKVSDKVRRKCQYFVMTREANAIPGHAHYHLLGYFQKDKPLTLKGFKVWSHTVEPLMLTSSFTPVKAIYDEFHADQDNVLKDFVQHKKNIQSSEGRRVAIQYSQTKRSQKEQIISIWNYIFKYAQDGHLYKDYIGILPPKK